MSKIIVSTIGYSLVASLIICDILTIWPSCCANPDNILFPINSALTRNEYNYGYNDNLAAVTPKPSSIWTRTTTISPYNPIKPHVLNNKSEAVTPKYDTTGWRWPWKKRKHEEKEITIPDDFGTMETKPKGKGRLWKWLWPTLIVGVIVFVIGGICAVNEYFVCLTINKRSNRRNTAVDTSQTPGESENTIMNGAVTVRHTQEVERHFHFPPFRNESLDNPPPYPGPSPPELQTPTSPPPPSYASGWVTLGLNNDAQFSKA